MNVKENEYLTGTWIRIGDGLIETPSSGYSYIINIEEYIKFIQDETIKKFVDTFILNNVSMEAKASMFPEHDAYYISNICKHYKGSEIISRIKKYEKKQQIKLEAEKQKKISDAKELLEKEGYVVYTVEEKKR